jgi:hypothetical protein
MEALDRETRNVIAAEWLASRENEYGWYDMDASDLPKYEAEQARVAQWDDEAINELIWDKMAEKATCENGGHEAWCCPFGCGPHLVPFDPISTEEDNA